MNKPIALIVLALLLPGLPAQAQQLTLFENVQQDSDAQSPARFEDQAMGPATGTPVFSLRSNSRFGAEYTSVLVDAAGNAIDIHWTDGQRIPVPNHAGFAVVGVTASGLSLEYPGNVPCQPQPAAGVSCSDSGVALLSLAPLPPLPAASRDASAMGPQPDASAGIMDDAGVVVDPEGNPVFVNPFAAAVEAAAVAETADMDAARAERARARAERLQQFQVERIADDQVPPGMRVVRTPFGDRLVPVRQ